MRKALSILLSLLLVLPLCVSQVGAAELTATLVVGENGTVSSLAGGTLNEGIITFEEGSELTFEVSAETGYAVDAFKVGDNIVPPNAQGKYVVTNLAAGATVSVSFKPEATTNPDYTLTITTDGNGSAYIKGSSATSGTFKSGETVEITIVPNENYKLSHYETGNTASELEYLDGENLLKVTVNDDLEVKFIFESTSETFNFTAIQSLGGKITPEGTDGVTECIKGESVKVSIKADPGYKIASYTINDNKHVVESNETEITKEILMYVDYKVSAVFEKIEGSLISFQIGEGGTVSPLSGENYYIAASGSNTQFTVTPAEGYLVDKVLINGVESVVTDNTFTITGAAGDYTVKVSFRTIATQTIRFEVGQNGNLNVPLTPEANGDYVATKDSSVTCTLSPAAGYAVDKVLVGEEEIKVNDDNSFTVLFDADKTVVISFVKLYNIIVINDGGGTVQVEGEEKVYDTNVTLSVKEGTNIILFIAADMDFELKSATDNGTDIKSSIEGGRYTISPVSSEHQIYLSFDHVEVPITTYTVTTSCNYGGIISPNSTQYIQEGGSITFTFTPRDGYFLKSVKVDGETVSINDGKFTLSNIARNSEIEATWEKEEEPDVSEPEDSSIPSSDPPSEDTSEPPHEDSSEEPDETDAIKVEDVNWDGAKIFIDLSEKTLISAEVLSKLEVSDKEIEIGVSGDYIWSIPANPKFNHNGKAIDFGIKLNNETSLFNYVSNAAGKLSTDNYSTDGLYVIERNENKNFALPKDTTLMLTTTVAHINATMELLSYDATADALKPLTENAGLLGVKGDKNIELSLDTNKFFALVEYTGQTYTVSIDYDKTAGEVTPATNTIVAAGASLDISFYANSDYLIAGLFLNNAEISDYNVTDGVGTYTVSNVQSDLTVVVDFELNEVESSQSSTEPKNDSGGVGTVILIVVIALAVIGGGVLFIVKWRNADDDDDDEYLDYDESDDDYDDDYEEDADDDLDDDDDDF